MSQLGPDWVPGPDGVPARQAARVILLDEQDRVLLARGHDVDDPGRSWWFTIGGGIEPGETPRMAAVREVAEETGLRIRAADLVGPVLARTALFDFFARTVRQHEQFFLARTRAAPTAELDRSGWTEVERRFMDEVAWFHVSELEQVAIEVFPRRLPGLVAWLIDGWDGTLAQIGEEAD